MPYLFSNPRYLIILLLLISLLFLGRGTLLSNEGNVKISENIESKLEHQPDEELHIHQPPLIYINSLPAFKLALEEQKQSVLDTGHKMYRAYYDYVESLTSILVTLVNYYSPKQFSDQTPQEFISQIIESRFRWYNVVVEPLGPGTRGRMARADAAAHVAGDVEKMIEDMVFQLFFDDILEDNFNYNEWVKAWGKSGFTPENND